MALQAYWGGRGGTRGPDMRDFWRDQGTGHERDLERTGRVVMRGIWKGPGTRGPDMRGIKKGPGD